MSLTSGQTWSGLIYCRDATGALLAPTVGPAGTLYVNGVANAAEVSITGTNPYAWSVTLPTLAAGSCVSMAITATIDGIATASVVAEDTVDAATVSEAAIADAVWDELLADHAVDGSTGEALAAIEEKTALLGTGEVTVTAPVSEDGDVSIIQGDDYDADESRALEWTNADGTWPDLTGATITLYVRAPDGSKSSYAGSVVTPTGVGQKVRVELTSAQTGALLAHPRLAIQLRAALAGAGHKVTLVYGTLATREFLG